MTPVLYWRHERSGGLAKAIAAYLNNRLNGGGALTPEQIGLIREYLTQWIDNPCWCGGVVEAEIRQDLKLLRLRARLVDSPESIETWLWEAMELGIDPL